MRTFVGILTLLLPAFTIAADRAVVAIEDGEYWWGGLSVDGIHMPYGREAFSRDLYGDNRGNQAQPLLISSHGRYVWSEKPIAYSFQDGELVVTSSHGAIDSGKAGGNRKDVYAHVNRNYFPT